MKTRGRVSGFARLRRGLQKLRAFTILTRDLNRVNEVFALVDAVVDDDSLDLSLAHYARHAQGARALEERPRLGRIDLEALRALPEGTLGRAYAEHMIANRLDPNALPQRATTSPRDFIVPHLYETHDVWHVVTGFGADVVGEVGLQGVYAAQSPAKGPVAITTAVFLNTVLFGIREKDARLGAFVTGWVLGKRAKPLFGARWAELWSVPIDEVRRRFGIDMAAAQRAVAGLALHDAIHAPDAAPGE